MRSGLNSTLGRGFSDRRWPCGALVLAMFTLVLVSKQPASAATLKASYLFNDNLNAQEVGAPALVAVDPLAANQFETATVFGQTRRVYHYDGNLSQQAGLTADTSGLITFNNYSVEIVFEFVENTSVNGWRRILDVHNGSPSDHALYVDADSNLDIWTNAGSNPGTANFFDNTFYHVVLTNANTGTAKVYLDGNLDLTLSTTVMNIDNLLRFFRDSPPGKEYSDGRVAMIRFYDGVLTGGEVAALASDPLPQAIPEPSTLLLLGTGLVGLIGYRKRQNLS